MSITMFSASVPMFDHYLAVLSDVLTKADAHAAAQNLASATLLTARLYPDMYPLIAQVQFACDFAKGAVARLAGVDVPSYRDDETTVAELQVRIAKTIDFMKSIDPRQIEGSEERSISLKFGGAHTDVSWRRLSRSVRRAELHVSRHNRLRNLAKLWPSAGKG